MGQRRSRAPRLLSQPWGLVRRRRHPLGPRPPLDPPRRLCGAMVPPSGLDRAWFRLVGRSRIGCSRAPHGTYTASCCAWQAWTRRCCVLRTPASCACKTRPSCTSCLASSFPSRKRVPSRVRKRRAPGNRPGRSGRPRSSISLACSLRCGRSTQREPLCAASRPFAHECRLRRRGAFSCTARSRSWLPSPPRCPRQHPKYLKGSFDGAPTRRPMKAHPRVHPRPSDPS